MGNCRNQSVKAFEPGDRDKVIVRYENNGSTCYDGLPRVKLKAAQVKEHDRELVDR